MDIDSPAWRAFAAEQQQRRAERNLMMLEKLGKLGLTLPEEYQPSRVPGEYGRMHMALGLRQAGYVSDVQQAFDLYLGHRAPAYVKRRKFASAELIRAVKAAGGEAVLAHPGRMEADGAEMERLVFSLKEEGLVGIEAYYPLHAPEESQNYAALGRKAGLVCTYGSDWHGLDESALASGFRPYRARSWMSR
jgi:predicted metal-dependent phosphoesterase TrpH